MNNGEPWRFVFNPHRRDVHGCRGGGLSWGALLVGPQHDKLPDISRPYGKYSCGFVYILEEKVMDSFEDILLGLGILFLIAVGVFGYYNSPLYEELHAPATASSNVCEAGL